MNQKQITNLRLITIAISHYCEKVRWALDWLNIPYVEESNAPPFHRFYTRRHGGSTVPVLVTEAGSFIDSTQILQYLDTIAPQEKKLYPTNLQLRQEVKEFEELFDNQLGVSTRCWGYFFALKNPLLVQQAWCIGVPWLEKVGCAIAFPVMHRLIQKKYNISPEEAAISLQRIRTVFDRVSDRLQIGQKYLVGNNFSAADLTFAALASPVLRPEHHPLYSSQLQGFPYEMTEIIRELRKTPAGTFALSLYRQQRTKK
jgi:glutathione S-transferase